MIIFEKAIDGVSQRGLEHFARQAQKLAGVKGEVAVLVAGNRRLRQLNRSFRRKDQPTDVLSFPRQNGNGGGDIAISADIAQANAGLYGHQTSQELKILVLHGMLHLAGYDHETDNGRMKRIETRLRARLKLPGSLIARAHGRGIARSHAAKPPERSKRRSLR